MQQYVLGIAFSYDHIIFVQKERPTWQAGLLNFPGGKVEDGETPLDAIRREFDEETGLKINRWENIGVIQGRDYTIDVFFTQTSKAADAETMTDETIVVMDLEDFEGGAPELGFRYVHNVHLLYKMAIDALRFPGLRFSLDYSAC